jgi:hypothetical protein
MYEAFVQASPKLPITKMYSKPIMKLRITGTMATIVYRVDRHPRKGFKLFAVERKACYHYIGITRIRW